MTDRIEEIRARHDAGPRGHLPVVAFALANADRATLLAEVERLREVIRTIRARCVEMDDSDAVSETLDIASAVLEDTP
jgi:hypothetical protein